MNLCRICLGNKPRKYITELKITEKGANVSYVDILLFSLDIKIEETKQFTRLCVKCYKQVLELYKFKKLAHTNDSHLKSIVTLNEVFLSDDIKKEESSISDTEFCDNDTLSIEIEPLDISENNDVKQELKVEDHEIQSDDELLSVMKKIKDEMEDGEETKENAPLKKKGKTKSCKTEPGPVTQVCEECGKSVKDLKAHARQHRPKTEQTFVKCEICDKMLSSKPSLKKHIKRKHIGDKKPCTICHKMVSNVKQHILIIHKPETLPFQCVPCGRRFICQSMLDTHITIHTKDRPYECDICTSKFRLKISLENHKRQVHDKEKSHLCQFCSKRFFKKYHLQLHLRSHTQEKPYECQECGRKFGSRTVLKNHMYIHSDDKSFQCTLCDMTFARQGYLSAHMKSHIKLKRYPCQYCGTKFHRSDHRRRHEFTAHLKHSASTAT